MCNDREVKSVRLTKKQYNYILPVVNNNKLLNRVINGFDYYYFFGNSEEIKDLYNRLKGLNPSSYKEF